MSVKDLFGLAVRLGGLYMILLGYFVLFHLAAAPFGYPNQHYTTAIEVVGALGWLVPGSALLLGAKPITNLAYWRDKE
jgi:hypothetical protein